MRRVVPGATPLAIIVATLAVVADGSHSSRVTVLRQAFSLPGNVTQGSAISADGRFVAFVSGARLLATDSNSGPDIYVFDRLHEALSLETLGSDGSASDGASSVPALSADGRYLVFDSTATNLTARSDGNLHRRVFFRDRLRGVTHCLSITADGEEANDDSEAPTISDDGSVVAFASHATNLVRGTDANGTGRDVYLVRVDTGELRRVSVPRQAKGAQSFSPSVSGDGHALAFASSAPMDQPGRGLSSTPPTVVYVQDIESGMTMCVSCDRGRDFSVRRAYDPHVSRDGRFVALTVETESGHRLRTDIALHDRTSSVTTLITHEADGDSSRPKISADGRFVVFESKASNLACQWRCSAENTDENLLSDIYLFDRQTRRFRRLSGGLQQWWAPSIAPSLDAHGLVVVFSSRQPYGPEDGTADFDLFVWVREENGETSRRRN